jgi:hypothetical protein
MSFLKGLKRQGVIAAAVALWVPAVAFGISVLWKYSTTPGQPAAPPASWPASALIKRKEGLPTLLMFAHPRCQCSNASLGELAIIMAHSGGQLDAQVFFYRPAHEARTWTRSDLWRTASAIPGVHVFEDREAVVAKSFGTFTSGQTLLYDSKGSLVFKGGITAYRGHSGDNEGRSIITALLRGEVPAQISLPVVTPVFGCSLRGE